MNRFYQANAARGARVWIELSDKDSKQLEELKPLNNIHIINMGAEEHKYLIDFNLFVQRNLQTGTTRKLCRRVMLQ